jgi:uncharacterized protein (DUF2461 family)
MQSSERHFKKPGRGTRADKSAHEDSLSCFRILREIRVDGDKESRKSEEGFYKHEARACFMEGGLLAVQNSRPGTFVLSGHQIFIH